MIFLMFAILLFFVLLFLYLWFFQGYPILGLFAGIVLIIMAITISVEGLSLQTKPVITDQSSVIDDNNIPLITTQIEYQEVPIHALKPDGTVDNQGVWFIVNAFPYVGFVLGFFAIMGMIFD